MTAGEHVQKWMARFDALTLRERGLVALAVAAVLIVVWQTFLIAPLDAARQRASAEIQRQRQQIQAFDMESQALLERQRQDPDRATREHIAALRRQMDAVDAELKGKMRGLIAPAQMAKVLEQVLTRKTDLKLYRVESQGASPLMTGVYRHGLVMEFRGSYLDTLTYLRELDRLPWQFYWDSIELDVKHYPEAQVTITVHTLSLDKDWIGV
ncbi:MAG TPA: type II secretion system protein GspM [Gammaproteobacteria bacterium]|nr:type II secretion system protein GspM [Gammaproteobacteria bacterium]